MALSSASSLTDVKNSYIDNAAYDVNQDASMCKAFIVACRILKMKMSMMQESGSPQAHLTMKPEEITAAEQRAMTWLAANDTGAGANNTSGPDVVRANFNNSRI